MTTNYKYCMEQHPEKIYLFDNNEKANNATAFSCVYSNQKINVKQSNLNIETIWLFAFECVWVSVSVYDNVHNKP